jgi:hypothetical protein
MGFLSLSLKRLEPESIPPLIRLQEVVLDVSYIETLETMLTQISGVSLYSYDFNRASFNRQAVNELLKDI